MSKLQIYKASAGSGKTYKLTGIYIELLIRNPINYRKILAITFTNKAAEEMSERILKGLVLLSKTPDDSSYLSELINHTGFGSQQIQERATTALKLLLYDYGHTSIGTIDSFFQQILRAFAREAGLTSGFSVELDTESVLADIADTLILESVNHEDWMKWLSDWIQIRMDEGKPWTQLQNEIISMGQQLLREQVLFEFLKPGFHLTNNQNIQKLKKQCEIFINRYDERILLINREVTSILESNSITVSDFSHKESSTVAQILKTPDQDPEVRDRERQLLNNPDRWVTKGVTGHERETLLKIVTDKLNPLLSQWIENIDNNGPDYIAAKAVRQNIYTLGLSSAIVDLLNRFGEEKNKFLIQLTNPFLKQITSENPTPFLFEKTGNFYRHFLVDEFQDTSDLQWDNLLPLLINSLSEGGTSLVVGDVKQSIYRWRNSNWRLLYQKSSIDLAAFGNEVHHLADNFRSHQAILDFNNSLFPKLANRIKTFISRNFDTIPDFEWLPDVYKDVHQSSGKNLAGGYVHVEFVSGMKDDEYDHYLESKIPALIAELQLKRGFKASDIAFLVRKNSDGDRISNLINRYLSRFEPVEGVNYGLSSPDTFRIGSATSIRLMLKALRYISDPENDFFLKMLKWQYLFFIDESNNKQEQKILLNFDDLIKRLKVLSDRPLHEMFNDLVSLFNLDLETGQFPYLMEFEDLITNFVTSERDHLPSFLEWWDKKGASQTIYMDESPDSMQVMTIHKAKGLEFPVVIIPYPDWSIEPRGFQLPTIWADTRNTPFSSVPFVPIKFSSKLKQTCFSDEYVNELGAYALDQLNTLYVALTRSKTALYLFASLSEKKDGSISGLLYEALSDQLKDDTRLSMGSQDFHSAHQTLKESEKIKVDHYTLAKTPLDLPVPIARESPGIQTGTLMHSVLAHIQTVSDLNNIDDLDIKELQQNPQLKKTLTQRITNLMEDERIRPWFTGAWKIENEKDILLPGGEMKRPDRIMISGDKTIVIDYKTGLWSSEYESQVRDYIRILMAMGYSNVKGFLLYLENQDLVEVTL